MVRLSPGAVLDYNAKSSHVLEIIAIDGGGLASSEPCIFNITLKDINNKKPRFEFNPEEGRGQGYVATIRENAPSGQIILKVNASDPDSSAVLRYSLDYTKSDARSEDGRLVLTSPNGKNSKLRGVDLAKLFVLDEITGVLSVGSVGLDREIMETIRLSVVVKDIASETGEQKVSTMIQVTIIE